MIVATQATREAGVRLGRVTARSTVSRWMANPPTATIAQTTSCDVTVITAPILSPLPSAPNTQPVPFAGRSVLPAPEAWPRGLRAEAVPAFADGRHHSGNPGV